MRKQLNKNSSARTSSQLSSSLMLRRLLPYNKISKSARIFKTLVICRKKKSLELKYSISCMNINSAESFNLDTSQTLQVLFGIVLIRPPWSMPRWHRAENTHCSPGEAPAGSWHSLHCLCAHFSSRIWSGQEWGKNNYKAVEEKQHPKAQQMHCCFPVGAQAAAGAFPSASDLVC